MIYFPPLFGLQSSYDSPRAQEATPTTVSQRPPDQQSPSDAIPQTHHRRLPPLTTALQRPLDQLFPSATLPQIHRRPVYPPPPPTFLQMHHTLVFPRVAAAFPHTSHTPLFYPQTAAPTFNPQFQLSFSLKLPWLQEDIELLKKALAVTQNPLEISTNWFQGRISARDCTQKMTELQTSHAALLLHRAQEPVATWTPEDISTLQGGTRAGLPFEQISRTLGHKFSPPECERKMSELNKPITSVASGEQPQRTSKKRRLPQEDTPENKPKKSLIDSPRSFTPEEDAKLIQIVDEQSLETFDWKKVARLHGRFTTEAVRQRLFHLRSLSISVNITPWTPVEDELLQQGVKKCRLMWDVISVLYFKGNRTKEQCRSRWRNEINPILKNGPLTDEERQRLSDFIKTPKPLPKINLQVYRLFGGTRSLPFLEEAIKEIRSQQTKSS